MDKRWTHLGRKRFIASGALGKCVFTSSSDACHKDAICEARISATHDLPLIRRYYKLQNSAATNLS
jgi:hypothetical protein